MIANALPANSLPMLESWRAAWPTALAVWSKYTRLHDARLCDSKVEAAKEGLSGSFAMIRLTDQSVVIDMATVSELGLEDYGVEILAHEIGHHVLAPGTVTDHFRLLARIRRALPTLEHHAPMIANLYTDLYINDRLQRQAGLRMADVYRHLDRASTSNKQKAQSGVWLLYLRIYENLWQLEKGSLGSTISDDNKQRFERLESDAWLGARLIRVYAGDWMSAAGSFATLFLSYLVDDKEDSQALKYLQDTKSAGQGGTPSGGMDIEPDEIEGAMHPAEDSRISGIGETADEDKAVPAKHAEQKEHKQGTGQTREPFEYGEILKAAGITLSNHDIAVRYYRERALPYLIPFPSRPSPESPEPQIEGLEPWDIGEQLDDIDWLQTLIQSSRPIPGLTTVKRVYGREQGRAIENTPVDLDLYVDSSGSMPNPQIQTSYLTLAGAIISLSALRAGSRIQVTLWSGKNQVTHTQGFVRDEDSILRVLTGFYGGGTNFPIHHLRETYASPDRVTRPVHILQISDDGISTMFDVDEKGNNGWDVSAKAMSTAGAGGTMALNLPAAWRNLPGNQWQDYASLKRAEKEQGWDIHTIVRLEDLLEFAHAFSRKHYVKDKVQGTGIRP